MQGRDVCQAIFKDVKAAFKIEFQQLLDARTFPEMYDTIAMAGPPRYGFLIVRWKPSSADRLTLNTDRCSKGNSGLSSGGGVLRNSNGDFVVGFSVFLGNQTSLRAEALVLLAGLRLSKERGWSHPLFSRILRL